MKRLIASTFFVIAPLSVIIATTDSRDEWIGPIKETESRLREQIGHENGPREIYALLSEGGWGGLGQRLILIFDDRTLLHCDDGNGRTRERELTKEELAKLKNGSPPTKSTNCDNSMKGAPTEFNMSIFISNLTAASTGYG